MEYRLKEYSIYEVGQRTDAEGRPHQEDSIYPPHGQGNDNDRLFVVCDGMGGHDAGEVASKIVCDTLSSVIRAKSAGRQSFSVADLQYAISAAYDALDKADTGSEKRMGTTLALLKLYSDGYFMAHIGDSRVYHIRPGQTAEDTEIIHRTEDHSLVNYLVRIGKMTPEEALVSPKRHVITRAMQPNMERRSTADIYQGSDVRAGDYFLLCSDGILEQINDDYLRYLFSHDGGNAKNKVNMLNKATADNSDNHSAIIVHITDVTEPVTEQPIVEDTTHKQKKKASDMKKTGEKSSKPATKAKAKKSNGDTMELLIKLLFIVMGLLVLIMLIYYLFIRSDENLQRAGTAIDAPIENGASGDRDETYGYEITQQDIINVNQEIAPEPPEPTDDVVTEVNTEDATTAAEESPSEPEPTEPEPILQE